MSHPQIESGTIMPERARSAMDSSNHVLEEIILQERHRLQTASSDMGDESFSMLRGLGRVGYVTAGGISDATSDAIRDWQNHADDAAIGLGMGFALGGLSKSGRFGAPAAALAGGALLAHWINAEINGDRWLGFGEAVSNSYSSATNLENNRDIAARSLGTFSVDLGIMGLTGAAGFSGARRILPENWASGVIGTVKAGTVKAGSLDLLSAMRTVEARPALASENAPTGATSSRSLKEILSEPISIRRESSSQNNSTAATLRSADSPGVSTESPSTALRRSSNETIGKETEILTQRISERLDTAQSHTSAFEIQKQRRSLEKFKSDIEQGKKSHPDKTSRDRALESTESDLHALRRTEKENPPKYAQTLKHIRDYIASVEEYYARESSAAARDRVISEAVINVERLMEPIDNIYLGVRNKSRDLPRSGDANAARMPEMRLAEINEHLQVKIEAVEGAYSRKLDNVRENVTFAELFQKFDHGELPRDGSVIFFTREGTLLYQSELSQARGQNKSAGLNHVEHVSKTPAFIDIARLENGAGADGAGLWRFIGHEGRISGAAVLRPVLQDGKPVELRRNGSRGKAMVKKEVESIIGEVPAEIRSGMAYGNLLNTMARARQSQSGNMAAETLKDSSISRRNQ